MRKRAWLVPVMGAMTLLLGWVCLQTLSAVVRVRFAPRESGKRVDYLFLTVGGTKLHSPGLAAGEEERFRFAPSPDEPLMMGFWIQGSNGGWDGPVLRPRHRLDVTLDETGHVTWTQCLWPCW